jgi:hypothetical protein
MFHRNQEKTVSSGLFRLVCACLVCYSLGTS